jgi:cytochrome P450
MRRTATEDTELAGQRISKGDKVVLWYLSGNFDEEAFDEPGRFDVTRSGPAHLGFGHGPHFCQGARLAEMQLTVLFQELLRRFPDMEPCGPVRRVRSNFIHGLKALPVRFTPER